MIKDHACVDMSTWIKGRTGQTKITGAPLGRA